MICSPMLPCILDMLFSLHRILLFLHWLGKFQPIFCVSVHLYLYPKETCAWHTRIHMQNVYSSIFHRNQKLEIIQMSINIRVDIWIRAYSYNIPLLLTLHIYIYSIYSYTSIKKMNELQIHAIIWVNPINLVTNRRNQTQTV